MLRRAALSMLCACLAVVLSAAPAGGQDDDPPTTLRIALNGYENNITPFTATFGAAPNTHDLLMLVYDSLFWSQNSVDPEPWLAESAEPSADLTQWTVTLRDGITWHDGRPLTAEDVRFSFDYYSEQRAASGRYAHHVFDVPPLAATEVLDDRTVRFTYSQPAPEFRTMPGADLPIIPRHIWENVADPRTNAESLPVGSGPYRLVEIVPDQLYRFEANESYFKGRPTVDVLEMPILRDPAAAFAALQTGEVSFVSRNVPPELFDRFSGEPGVTIAEGTKYESNQLYFNARKAPLDDPRLRHAMSLTVDSQAIVDTVLLGRGTPGLPTFLHPDTPWAQEGAQVEYDPAQAQTILDQAGYARGPDGIRVAPDGTPLQFTVLVNSFEPQDIRAAQLIGQQLAPLGVGLTAEALDPATLRARRAAPPGEVPTYDAYISVIESHAHVDPDALYYFFHSPGPQGFGASITGWANPEFDRIVEQATTAGAEDRTTLLAQAQDLLAAENPLVVLWYRNGEYAYRDEGYDGWVSDPGHGIFTKRSFLPEYVEAARAQDTGTTASTEGDAGGTTPWVAIGAGAVLLAGGAALVARRRRAADAGDDD